MSKYNYLGTTDAFNECGCCGKQGLKKVAVLEDVDSGAVVYFGTTCAANAAGWSSDEYKAVKKSLRTKRRAEAVKLQKAAAKIWFAAADTPASHEAYLTEIKRIQSLYPECWRAVYNTNLAK